MLEKAGNELSVWRAVTGQYGEEGVRITDGRRDEEKETSEKWQNISGLGPPPPCPTLWRQKATDFTAEREKKRAVFFGRRELMSSRTRIKRRLHTDRCLLML